MINILIVEDNAYKSETIIKLLKEDLMIPDNFINSTVDIKSAKRLLAVESFDLLILDLVLPLEVGDLPTPDKGVGFLKDINTNPNLKPPIHIIGLTEFKELKPKFDEEFNNYMWHLINYNAAEINWQEKLKNLIIHLINTRRSFFEKNQYQSDVAIITALNFPEFDYVLKLSKVWTLISIPGDATKYYSTTFTSKDKEVNIVAACVDQMGLTATANLATRICLNFKPKYIFMSGICAGLKEKELNFGDIIIAEQSWDYGSGKIKESYNEETLEHLISFEPDPRPILLCPELKSKINAFIRKDEFLFKIQKEWHSAKSKFILKANLGPLASGSYLIASEEILSHIKAMQRKLLGVDMETYGLYYSAEQSPNQYTKPIAIKAVSDYGDNKKNSEFQEYASYTSAQYIFHFITNELFEKT